MDRTLYDALEAIHGDRRQWVYLSTVNKNGEPHVAPMFMDFDERACYFSLTGHRKKVNLRRDPRACVAISKPFRSTAHLIIWGRMEMHDEPEHHPIWREMVTKWMGAEGKTVPRDRPLSWDKTSFGIFTPYRWRIFGLER